MQYCSRCVMPNTKPGVLLDDQGICSACRSVEKKEAIDWEQRAEELAAICDRVRGSNGNGYDCVVPVSGGKDSHYQVYMMKVVHRMKVLTICVVPHLQTKEGIANLNNIVKAFGVDMIKVSLKPSVFKDIRRKAFLELGEPNWADHCSVFAGAARAAYMYRVPLVVWGEDIAVEFGGTTSKERVASAEDLIKNDLIRKRTIEDFYQGAVGASTTVFYRHPEKEELKHRGFQSLYLGYYHNWDGKKHYEVARRYGFQPRARGPLTGNLLDYDNIDEKLCEINIWFKFLKFGFWRPTDQCCYQIWNGRMARPEAVRIVNELQYQFPGDYLDEFLEFNQVTKKEFEDTVERFRNRDIWEKKKGKWRLKVDLC